MPVAIHSHSGFRAIHQIGTIQVSSRIIRAIPAETSKSRRPGGALLGCKGKRTWGYGFPMLLLRKVGRRLKLAIFGLPSPQLDPRIFALEQVFRSPPLTRSLVSAIHLISPHCDFRPNERNRRIWEADENGACWAEFELVRDELAALPKRARILEIGPGLGRSLIFFSKKLG